MSGRWALVSPRGFMGPWRRVCAARGHHLYRQTAVEIGRVGFPFFEIGGFAVEQRVDKAVILRLIHRAIDIILARAAGAELVIARLDPADIHIDAVVIDNRRTASKRPARPCPSCWQWFARAPARSAGL